MISLVLAAAMLLPVNPFVHARAGPRLRWRSITSRFSEAVKGGLVSVDGPGTNSTRLVAFGSKGRVESE